MHVVPLTATMAGLVLTAGAAFAIDTAPSTLDVHRVAFVVPADIADGSGSDGSGGCAPGAACMLPPGAPLTANGTSSGPIGSNTPPLPVPGSDPDEIASHHAKPSTGDLGSGSAGTAPDPVAPAASPPDELPTPMPLGSPAATSSAGGGTATGGGTPNGAATSNGDLSPNQAMDLVATILGAVAKFITKMLG